MDEKSKVEVKLKNCVFTRVKKWEWSSTVERNEMEGKRKRIRACSPWNVSESSHRRWPTLVKKMPGASKSRV